MFNLKLSEFTQVRVLAAVFYSESSQSIGVETYFIPMLIKLLDNGLFAFAWASYTEVCSAIYSIGDVAEFKTVKSSGGCSERIEVTAIQGFESSFQYEENLYLKIMQQFSRQYPELFDEFQFYREQYLILPISRLPVLRVSFSQLQSDIQSEIDSTILS